MLKEGSRAQAIDALLSRPNAEPVLPAPALTEVLSTVRRRGHGSSMDFLAHVIAARGIRSEVLTAEDMVRAAHLLRLSDEHPGYGKPHGSDDGRKTLSLGDALILSIVERLSLPVVTHDHYWREFAADGLTNAHVVVI